MVGSAGTSALPRGGEPVTTLATPVGYTERASGALPPRQLGQDGAAEVSAAPGLVCCGRFAAKPFGVISFPSSSGQSSGPHRRAPRHSDLPLGVSCFESGVCVKGAAGDSWRRGSGRSEQNARRCLVCSGDGSEVAAAAAGNR